MVELSYFGLFVLAVSCLAGGVCAAVVHTWALRALAYSLDTRLSIVEGNLIREVKARAGQERWKAPPKMEQELQAALALAQQNKQTVNQPWWNNPNIPRSYSAPQ